MVPYALSRRRSTFLVASAFALVAGLSGCTAKEPAGLGAAVERQAGHELAGSLHGRTSAYLIVRDAASRIEVRFAELPGLLYRITTPAEAGLAPQVTGPDGLVRLALRPTGGDGPDEVTIVLNRAARWDIRLPAGAGEQHLDLTGGRVARLDLGSAGLIDVRLPRPVGVVPITLTGGAGTVQFSTPRATPVRVRLPAGTGTISAPWTMRVGTPLRSSPGRAAGAIQYVIDARAGVAALSVR